METPVSATDATMNTDATMYGDKDESYFGVPRREIAPLLPDRIDRVLEIGCGAGATVKWLRATRFERGMPARSDGDICSIFQGDEERENFADRVFQIRIAKDDNFASRDAYTVTDRGPLAPVRKAQYADAAMGGLKSASNVRSSVR